MVHWCSCLQNEWLATNFIACVLTAEDIQGIPGEGREVPHRAHSYQGVAWVVLLLGIPEVAWAGILEVDRPASSEAG